MAHIGKPLVAATDKKNFTLSLACSWLPLCLMSLMENVCEFYDPTVKL